MYIIKKSEMSMRCYLCLQLKKATVNEFLQQIYGTCRPLTSSPQIRRVVCRFKFLPEDTTREDIVRSVSVGCYYGNSSILSFDVSYGGYAHSK